MGFLAWLSLVSLAIAQNSQIVSQKNTVSSGDSDRPLRSGEIRGFVDGNADDPTEILHACQEVMNSEITDLEYLTHLLKQVGQCTYRAGGPDSPASLQKSRRALEDCYTRLLLFKINGEKMQECQTHGLEQGVLKSQIRHAKTACLNTTHPLDLSDNAKIGVHFEIAQKSLENSLKDVTYILPEEEKRKLDKYKAAGIQDPEQLWRKEALLNNLVETALAENVRGLLMHELMYSSKADKLSDERKIERIIRSVCGHDCNSKLKKKLSKDAAKFLSQPTLKNIPDFNTEKMAAEVNAIYLAAEKDARLVGFPKGAPPPLTIYDSKKDAKKKHELIDAHPGWSARYTEVYREAEKKIRALPYAQFMYGSELEPAYLKGFTPLKSKDFEKVARSQRQAIEDQSKDIHESFSKGYQSFWSKARGTLNWAGLGEGQEDQVSRKIAGMLTTSPGIAGKVLLEHPDLGDELCEGFARINQDAKRTGQVKEGFFWLSMAAGVVSMGSTMGIAGATFGVVADITSFGAAASATGVDGVDLATAHGRKEHAERALAIGTGSQEQVGYAHYEIEAGERNAKLNAAALGLGAIGFTDPFGKVGDAFFKESELATQATTAILNKTMNYTSWKLDKIADLGSSSKSQSSKGAHQDKINWDKFYQLSPYQKYTTIFSGSSLAYPPMDLRPGSCTFGFMERDPASNKAEILKQKAALAQSEREAQAIFKKIEALKPLNAGPAAK